MTSWSHALVAALVSLSLLSGCGWWRAETARQETLTQQLDAYVIPTPIDQVWPRVREPQGDHDQLLWDGITWSDSGPYAMVSSRDREVSKQGDGTTVTDTTWYDCHAIAVPGGTRVRYTRFVEERKVQKGSRSGPTVSERRAIDLELGLIRLLDPAAGARIDAAGESAAKKAK